MRCEPANSLITKLGGLTRVSRIVGVSPNGIMRWRMPKSRGGTGGAVPHWHIAKLIADAEVRGIPTTLTDFYLATGQDVAPVDSSCGTFVHSSLMPRPVIEGENDAVTVARHGNFAAASFQAEVGR